MQQRVQNAFDAAQPQRRNGDTVAEYLLVPAVLMRLLFPLMTLLAVYLFLRGHDLPGGGFVAGLIVAIALILQYMVGGTRWVEARLRLRPIRWIGIGLLLAPAHRRRRLAVRLSVPDLAHVPASDLPGIGALAAGQRAALRPRRVHRWWSARPR